MRSLSLAMVLLALLSGCTIHEPVYQIIYTPDKHLTNNAAAFITPPVPRARLAQTSVDAERQASR